ncbi:L,D-transpeptidase catalytic domain [Thalassovita autumnalis]|uniref:L,D-transpeptidase catalytic domain n=1 Tax=Thalassovita autumnalis TaxID=2072972 RepID=A0A0P1FEB5_9RHOB|nr:L,D-transpeptidase family protein [Thalassovita autumnalis]CUH66383.1 L,D-transpeptidase catalytic domain [Thalassovita autumnalis]CUH72637.1 L,D-transpeptidase catalytic domain [Thalassovita autumnalis]
MRNIKVAVLTVALMALAACSSGSKFRSYHGPEVTRIIVQKSDRMMYLMHHDKVLKSFDIGLGFSPEGDKLREGDGKTPEGTYFINRRNPNSKFHLSVGINYPDTRDMAEARAAGVDPGGDIFIHGRPEKYRNGVQDWTAGCIAVTDREVELIYAMVKNGTPITINP